MKKLVLILSLAFSLSGFAQSFRPLDPANQNDRFLMEGNQLALSWIQNFANMPKIKNSPKHTDLINKILQNSSSLNLRVEKESASAPVCKTGKDGSRSDNYALLEGGNLIRMFFCNDLIKNFTSNLEAIAQVAVHEYYHFWEVLSGYPSGQGDEDYAGDFEMSVSLYNIRCIPITDKFTDSIAAKFKYKNYRPCN